MGFVARVSGSPWALRADQGFLTVFVRFLVTGITVVLVLGIYARFSVFTLSFPNLSLLTNTLGILV